jgi:hypothetical protein
MNVIILVVGYRSSTSYGYSFSSIIKGVAVTYHNNYDVTIEGTYTFTGSFTQQKIRSLQFDRIEHCFAAPTLEHCS